MEHLKEYDPIVVGTIPIECDIDSSDVDILLYSQSVKDTATFLQESFGHLPSFDLLQRSENCLLCQFVLDDFQFELYCCDTPTQQQMGYLHLLKEHELLNLHGQELRKKVIYLKKQGLKTEPAFCKALHIEGDAFVEILKA